MKASIDCLLSCEHCGVVVDHSSYVMEQTTIFNRDGDKQCKAYICPVCKGNISSEEWEPL